MDVRRNFFREGQSRPIAYPFQIADDAMQIGVHKRLYPLYTTKMPMLRQQSQKM